MLEDADKTRLARAFNAGADARILGRPLTANPYRDESLSRQWQAGWRHCNAYYARDVEGRWPVRRLPRVLVGAQ